MMIKDTYQATEDSAAHKLYELCREVTDNVVAELERLGKTDPQIELPIIFSDDMVLTISRGPDTKKAIADFKSKAN